MLVITGHNTKFPGTKKTNKTQFQKKQFSNSDPVEEKKTFWCVALLKISQSFPNSLGNQLWLFRLYIHQSGALRPRQ